MSFVNSTEIDVPLPSYTRAFWSSAMSMNSPGAAIGSLCLAVVWIWRHFVDQKKISKLPLPPFVPLTVSPDTIEPRRAGFIVDTESKQDDEMRTPIDSLTKALRDYGPVIAIRRNGKKVYIVAKEFTRRVLTEERSFSFEHGLADMMDINWIFHVHGGSFFKDIDSLVRDLLTKRLEKIAPRVWPILDRKASELVEGGQCKRPVDILPYVQASMAEATVTIFLGEKYQTPEVAERVAHIAEDVAELFGLFRSSSFLGRNFPRLWQAFTWIKVVLIQLPYHLGSFGWDIWGDISDRKADDKVDDENVVGHLVGKLARPDGSISFGDKVWILVLIVTILFSSVHQTVTIMTWTTFYLAQRPDCQQDIRDEITSILNKNAKEGTGIDYWDLKNAAVVDSFIREVLRMKNDSVNLVRSSVKDTEMGGYIIPKGSMVYPMTYQSYRSTEFLADPDVFDAKRWIGTRKAANTTGPGYLAFGIGKWACPGRFLAVMEIKCWILALVKAARFELEDGKYEVVDPYNITSVPPRGRLVVQGHDDEL